MTRGRGRGGSPTPPSLPDAGSARTDSGLENLYGLNRKERNSQPLLQGPSRFVPATAPSVTACT